MGERRRALTGNARDLAARLATLALVALALGTLPGSRSRSILFERAAPPLPASLEHDAELSVSVRADEGKRAVPHARVRIVSMIEGRAYLAGLGETDAAGRAVLKNLPRKETWVLVDAEGYARASTHRVLDAKTLAIDVALGVGHALRVLVADDLGKPVQDADVEVSGAEPLPVGAKTDAIGLAETKTLGADPYVVSVHAPGYDEVVKRGVHEGETVRVVLRRLGALMVSVLDENGLPAPLARVSVAGTGLWPSRTTDTHADGTVRIAGLGAGSYALRATSGENVSPTDIGIPLARGEERKVSLRLAHGVFASARILEETNDGAPVTGARVTLVEGGLSPFPIEALSDESGGVRMGPVSSGTSLLSAQAEGFVPRGAIDVPADGHVVTVVMVRAGVIEGRVVDGRGRPVGGATIALVGSSASGDPIDDDPQKRAFQRSQFNTNLRGLRPLIPSGELGVVPGPVPAIPMQGDLGVASTPASVASPLDEPWVTKEDGTFRASPASPGRIRVVVRHPEYLEALSEVVTLSPAGEAHVEITLHEGGALEGRVVDTAGRPVAGANVAMAALRGSIERRTRSATDGTYAFAAVPEAVVVTASLGEEDARVARGTVEVPEHGKATLTLTLADARPSLDVRVRDDRGYPVAAAQVSVGSIDPTIPLRTTAFTDSHGDATVPGARGVALRLEAAAPGHASRSVTLGANETSAEIVLEPAETVGGLVKDARTGAPLKGAVVTLLATDEAVRRAETDAEGRYHLIDVGFGTTHLRVRAEGHVTVERTVTVQRSSGDHDLAAIELGDEAVVEGTVVDARGEPVRGARVGKDAVPTFVPTGSHDPSCAITDKHGHFRLGGLEDGVVTLEAYTPDIGRARLGSIAVTHGRTTSDVTLRLEAEPGAKSFEPSSSGGVAVTLGELSGEPREVIVVAVAEGSEAERASLRAGDILETVDGLAVHATTDARARLSGPVSDDVVVAVRRGERHETLRVPREAVRR